MAHRPSSDGMIDRMKCPVFNALGFVFVVIGAIGTIVPGLPTTVFLIAACWCFSRGSDRFRTWLWNHPVYGPTLRDWHEHRVVPRKAKIMAALFMATSLGVLVVASGGIGWTTAGVGGVMLAVITWLARKPSSPPGTANP